MDNYLNASEIEAATNLLNGGLNMAKTSMEQILQSPIDLKKIDYGSESHELPHYETSKDGKLHMIKTELKGQLTGSCFLIFSSAEVDKIHQACLPEEVFTDDSEEGQMMKTAFLKEMDNMVAAAVVTEISNILDLELFGDVPSAYLMDAEEVNGYLTDESQVYRSVIHFKALFHGKELDISPDFVWMFSEKFVAKIKDLV